MNKLLDVLNKKFQKKYQDLLYTNPEGLRIINIQLSIYDSQNVIKFFFWYMRKKFINFFDIYIFINPTNLLRTRIIKNISIQYLILIIIFLPSFILTKKINENQTKLSLETYKNPYLKLDTLHTDFENEFDRNKKISKQKEKKYSVNPVKPIKKKKKRRKKRRKKIKNLSNQNDTTTYNDTTDISISADLNTKLNRVIRFAKKHIGIRYRRAGISPRTGFDCSGFVKYVLNNFGYEVPRSSRSYRNFGTRISKKNCRKGDVIIFGSWNRRRIGHVGIVLSNNNGNIKFIHSATSRRRGITISDLNQRYYKKRFFGIRRIIK